MWQFVGYFILFIFCSAVVYTWGLLKSRKAAIDRDADTEMPTDHPEKTEAGKDHYCLSSGEGDRRGNGVSFLQPKTVWCD